VNGKNKIFILMHVKKIDFILNFRKKYLHRNLAPKNHSPYPNNQGVPPARKKGYSLCRQRPFPYLLSGYPCYFGSLFLSLTQANGRGKKTKTQFPLPYIDIFQ
jgi:hypothetical protein